MQKRRRRSKDQCLVWCNVDVAFVNMPLFVTSIHMSEPVNIMDSIPVHSRCQNHELAGFYLGALCTTLMISPRKYRIVYERAVNFALL